MSLDLGTINYKVNADTTGMDASYQAAEHMAEGMNDAAKATENLERKSEGAAEAARKNSKEVDKAAQSAKNLGNIGRQAGFQLQDVVVQLQSGTNAAIVFSQQGSQLLSVFHPLLGLAASLGGVLAGVLLSSLMSNSKALSEMSDNTKELIKDLNNLSDAQKGIVNAGLSYSIADQTKKYNEQTKEIEKQTAAIKVLQDQQGKKAFRVVDSGFGMPGAVQEFTVDNTEKIAEATKQLTAVEIERIQTLKQIQALQDPSGSQKKILALTDEAALIGETGRAYWEIKAAQEGITGAAMKQYVAVGMLSDQKKADLKASQDAASEAERERKKAEEDEKRRAEQATRNEERRRDSIKKMTKQLQRENDLFNVNSKAAQVEYDILHGLIPVVDGLAGAEAQRLLIQARRNDILNDEIDLAKQLDAEIDRRLEKEKKAADEAAKIAKEQADDIKRSITDGLMRGFESGKGIAENFRKTTENIFKTMVLRPSIEFAADKLTGALSGVLGKITGAVASMGGGGAGGLLASAAPYAGIGLAVGAGIISSWNKKQDEKFLKMTAEYKQGNQNLVNVLGDGLKKSEAINNGINLLERNSSNALDVNHDMLATLIDIRQGIGGIAAGFSRTLTGSGDYKAMGITEGSGTSGAVKSALGVGAAVLTGGISLVGNLLGGQVGGFVDGVINTVASAVYSKKKKVIDSGIEIIGGSLGDLLEGATLQAFNYADVKTTKKIFGVTTSAKKNRKREDLDAAFEAQISGVFENAGKALKQASGIFEINFDSYVDRLQIKAQDLSLKGLTGDALIKEIESFFGATMDNWAETLLGGTNVLVDLQKAGESSFDAILRLSTQTSEFSDYAKKLSLNFNETGVAAVYASDHIADLSGGFDKLTAGLDIYYDKFFDDSEKLASSGSKITEFFNSLNVAVPTTRDEFKLLVQSLDLTNEAQQKQFASLIQVAGAVDQYIDAQEKFRQKQKEAARELAQETYSGLERAVNAQKKIIDAQITTVNKSLDSSRAVYGALNNTLNGLIIDSDRTREATRRQAQNSLNDMLTDARRGILPNIDKLNQSLSVISQPSEDLYSTFQDYAKDFYATAGTIKELQDAAGKQVGTDEKSLAELERQVAQYDEMLAWAKRQVDAINGVDISVMSVSSALYAFASAVGVQPQTQDQIMAALAANSAVPIDPNSPQAQQAQQAQAQSDAIANMNKEFNDFMRSAMIALNDNTYKINRVVEDWQANGMPPEREEI